MSGKYILRDRVPVLCDNVLEWAKWIEEAAARGEMQVDWTVVDSRFVVSTIFMGLDYNFARYIITDNLDAPPLVFETMVFDDFKQRTPLDFMERYSTWDEAMQGHARAVEWVRTQAQVKDLDS